jgi:hypothetical protein
MIHTNFSFTGDPKRGSGHIRYKTAEDLFYPASQQNNLTVRFILQNVSRSLWHSLTVTDLRSLPENAGGQKFVNFTDFIPRFSSTASVAIQGVKSGESTDYTTMWTVLGFPLTSVVFPLWLCQGAGQPELVTLNGEGVAPLCEKALKLKGSVFPVTHNYKANYINLSILYNQENRGFMQLLKPVEDEIFDISMKRLEVWRKNPDFKKEIQSFYKQLDEEIAGKYRTLFGI